jgi:DNA polymerase III epsilon subunit-like protein
MIAILFDLETTSLILPSTAEAKKQPHIIELGGLAVDEDYAVIGQLSRLIDPGIPLRPETTKITGIKPEDLVGAPTFRDFLPTLIQFFTGSTVLIAHNAPFDTTVLQHELKRAECTAFPWPAETFCTLQEYAAEMGYGPHLVDLYAAVCGVPLKQVHRALDDARAMLEIVRKDDFFKKVGLKK